MACEPILLITNGTTSVDLLRVSTGFMLSDYTPSAGGYKGGGVFQDSPLSDNRRMVFRRRENVSEAINVALRELTQDNFSTLTRRLRSLLEQAGQYWIDYSIDQDTSLSPVWIEARGRDETNSRYAVLYDGAIADDPNYWRHPFMQGNGVVAVESLTIAYERGDWLSHEPKTGYAIPLASYALYGTKFHLVMQSLLGSATAMTVTDGAAIQDLPTGANGMTVEGWIQAHSGGQAKDGYIWNKGWLIRMDAQSALQIVVPYSTTAARAAIPAGALDWDVGWLHYALTYDDSGNEIRLWIAGTEITARGEDTVTGSGTYTTDVGTNLTLGNSAGSRVFDGYFGWQRISNVKRYSTSTITVPALSSAPAVDANTVVQYNMTDSTGTVDNAEGTAAYDGTVTNAYRGQDLAYYDYGRTFGNIEGGFDGEPVYTTDERDVFCMNAPPTYQMNKLHDGSSGSNLIDGTYPVTIKAAASATAAYFGSNSSLGGGPVFAMVLDIEQAAVGSTVTWQYWNGAWTTITGCDMDTSEGFKLTGKHVFSWEGALDWVASAPGTLASAFWIRANFSVATTQAVTLASRPYIPKNYFEIDQSALSGDLATRLKLRIDGYGGNSWTSNRGSQPSGGKQLILGARSVSRGKSFRSWLPFGENSDLVADPTGAFERGWYPTGVWTSDLFTTQTGTLTFEENKGMSPSGRNYKYVTVAYGEDPAIALGFDPVALQTYAGKYRVFLVCTPIGSSAGLEANISVQTLIEGSANDPLVAYGYYQLNTTRWVGIRRIQAATSAEDDDQVQCIDFGEITLTDDASGVAKGLVLTVRATSGTLYPGATLYLYGFYLIPSDELFIQANVDAYSAEPAGELSTARYAEVGGLLGASRAVTHHPSLIGTTEGDIRAAKEVAIANDETYRVHYFMTGATFFNPDNVSLLGPNYVSSVTLTGVDRFLAMRGDG